MLIRRSEEKDLDEVLALHRKLDDFHTDNEPNYIKRIETEPRRELFLNRLNSEDGFYTVAEIDGKVAGFVNSTTLEIKENPYRIEKKFLKIEDVIVDEKYRGRNIATEIFKYLENYAKDKGLDYIEVGVCEFNSAKSFYESAGLRPFMRIMRKDLK